MRNKNFKRLIKLQMKMIAEEKCLWIIMMVLIIAFVIIKVENFSLFENENLNSIVDNISYSIIAAFIFYVLTVFYPRSKNCLKMYHNIYKNVSRIDDIMEPTFKLFVEDINNIRQLPQKFVEKFIDKKDKEHDKYTINPYIARCLTEMLPKILRMVTALRSRYTDILRPEELSKLDVMEDAAQIITKDVIKNEMSYKEVEVIFLQLINIYAITRGLLNEYKQFE